MDRFQIPRRVAGGGLHFPSPYRTFRTADDDDSSDTDTGNVTSNAFFTVLTTQDLEDLRNELSKVESLLVALKSIIAASFGK